MKPGNSLRTFTLCLTLILTGLPTLSSCARLVEETGKIVGGIAGTKAAELTPVPTTTKTTNKGGNWCDTMDAMGGLVPIQPDDKLSRPTTERIVTMDQYGVRHCGWK